MDMNTDAMRVIVDANDSLQILLAALLAERDGWQTAIPATRLRLICEAAAEGRLRFVLRQRPITRDIEAQLMIDQPPKPAPDLIIARA